MYRQKQKQNITFGPMPRESQSHSPNGWYDLDPTPPTGVHTSESVILGRRINGNGISARSCGGLNLVVLLLVLLDIFCIALALLIELLVLSLDLGLAVLGVGTTAAGTVWFILLVGTFLEME
jgi:hypothetical protein